VQIPNTGDNLQDREFGSDISLGIFTVVAIVLLLWGFCWLRTYSSLLPPQRINVVFCEVAGLNENAAVYVDGMRVGLVDKMRWQSEHHVLVCLRINSLAFKIPRGSKFEILTNGIVGAKYVQVDMPEIKPGVAPPPPLTEQDAVQGEDPVRPELAVNKLAITLSEIDPKQVGQDFKADRKRLVRAADQLAILADKSMPVVDRALPLENDLSGLTKDLRRTSRKIANMFDDPHFSSDLKETARQAREAAQSIDDAIHELNATLADKPIRKDLLQSFHELNQSTAHISQSLESLQQVAADKSLRSDLKQILREAHSTLETVNEITSKPMGADLRSTLHETNDAITHLDLAARQMNQILAKRSPLLHLMFGRPGYIKVEKRDEKSSTGASSGAASKAGSIPASNPVSNPASIPVSTPALEPAPPPASNLPSTPAIAPASDSISKPASH
jgi:ABC-type transporter Mla subunit MlaD